MSSLKLIGESADFELALSKFPLAAWCARRGFVAQGRAKLEYLNDCPWCGAEDKLSVNPSRKFWRCFVCAKKFTLLDLLAEFEGGHAQAAEMVRASSGGRTLAMIPEEYREVAAVERPAAWEPWPIAPPQSFAPLTGHTDYTARRGFDIGNLLALGVGVCTWGRYQDRLVFPVRRWDGHWIYFQSRATWEKSEHDETTCGKYRKNLNPANDDPTRFASAGDVVLGLELAARYQRIAVVEGPTDWIQSGPDAVALFGKALSDRQITLLARAGVREIDVCLDPDVWKPPSYRDTHGRVEVLDKPPPGKVVADKLAAHFTVRVVRYPESTDPGSFSVAENHAFRAQALPWGTGSRLAFIP
ncbi:MAG TPA: hypothetical protein VIH11_00880 [Gemmatimonadaceae bacterium]